MMAHHGPSVTLLQALVVVAFVAVHLFAGHLRCLYGVPRSRWLSVGGQRAAGAFWLHMGSFAVWDWPRRSGMRPSVFLLMLQAG